MPGGWDDVGLVSELTEAVAELGWLFPRDVQDEAIPLILGGGDVMVAAVTGSGKTGAFGLPIIQTILEQRRYENRPAPKLDEAVEAAGAARPMALSSSDRDSISALEDDGLTCHTSHVRFWGGARATKSVKDGAYFFEATMGPGIGRVGFSTAGASLELGMDAAGFGYGGTAKKSNGKRFDDYGVTYKEGDVIGCYADMQRKEISFSVNGTAHGVAFKLPQTFQGGWVRNVSVDSHAHMHGLGSARLDSFVACARLLSCAGVRAYASACVKVAT
jgi:ATP-dependent RNA helicase DDX1